MTSRMTGPRRLPTWTVPEGVLESLTTCGPETRAASSSAHSISEGLGDREDLVVELAGGALDGHVLAFLLAEEGATTRALVADPALGRLGPRRPDDGERRGAARAADLDGRAD